MVVIHVKKTEVDQFLFECRTSDSNDATIRELCAISNLREKIARLAGALEELSKHGPMKPEPEKGLDEIQEKDGKTVNKGPHYNPDPIGHRNGNPPEPRLQDVLRRTAEEGKVLLAKEEVSRGTALTSRLLQEKIDNMRGAVTMAYPMGLPDNDTVRLLVEDGPEDGILQELIGNDYLDPATSTLWMAGKEFFRDQTVGDRVGKNEKTKVVGKLQRKGGGAPAREPAVTDEERKSMMAWYFKKQEEEKAIAEANDDDYLASSWADPKALKRDLMGTGGISFRPAAAGAGKK